VLRRVEYEGVVLDVCPVCGGIWFDGGELDEVMRSMLARPGEVRRLDRRPAAAEDRPHRTLTCVRCGEAGMIRERYGQASDVELDRCLRCGSVWSDGGELTALVQFLTAPAGPDPMRAFGEALARTIKQREQLKDLTELGRTTGRRVSIAWLFLPKIILPLKSSPQSRLPLVTIAIALVCTAILVAVEFSDDPRAVLTLLGLVPARILQGEQLHGLVTNMFLHIGIFHLVGNMIYLWVFGGALEEWLDGYWLVVLFLLLGLAANLTFMAVRPDSTMPAIGASGAVSGLMGVFLVMFPSSSIKTFFVHRVLDIPTWLFLGCWIGYQLLLFYVAQRMGLCSGAALSAHIGGFFAGVAMGFWMRRKKKAAS
jgi:membrane associated rhomboid family serine protease/Zn-finger nucleic acid-binding protein